MQAEKGEVNRISKGGARLKVRKQKKSAKGKTAETAKECYGLLLLWSAGALWSRPTVSGKRQDLLKMQRERPLCTSPQRDEGERANTTKKGIMKS